MNSINMFIERKETRKKRTIARNIFKRHQLSNTQHLYVLHLVITLDNLIYALDCIS